MDPKAVMHMVREQKKHINDTYSNNTQSTKQQASTSSMSNSSSTSLNNSSTLSNNNNNNNNNNSATNLYQQSSHSKSNSINNNNSNSYLNAYSANINSNKRTDQLPVQMIQQKTNFTSPSNINNNQKLYNNNNNNNEKVNRILNNSNLNTSASNNNLNNLQAHLNKVGFKQINDYYSNQSSSCLAPPPPPPSVNTHYTQDLHPSFNNTNSNIINQMHQSRSGSVKSTASDSGVGSTSPLSDCSDYGSNNNNISYNQTGLAYQQRMVNDLNKQKQKLPQQHAYGSNMSSNHINQNTANNNNSIRSLRDFQQYLANDPSAVFNSNNPYSFNNLDNEQISAIINSRKRKNNPATNVYDDFILNKYGGNILAAKYNNPNNNNNNSNNNNNNDNNIPTERTPSLAVTNLNDNIKNINFNDIHHRNVSLINNNNSNNNNTRNLMNYDDKCCSGFLINNSNNHSSNHHNTKSPIHNNSNINNDNNHNNNNNATPIPPIISTSINKQHNNGNHSNLNMNHSNKQMHHQSLGVMGFSPSLQPPVPPPQSSASQFASSHCDCADCQINKPFNQNLVPSSPLSQVTSGLQSSPPSCDCAQCNAALLQQQQLKYNHSRNLLMNNNLNNHTLINSVKHSSSTHLSDFITNNKMPVESNKLSAFSTNNSSNYVDAPQLQQQQQPKKSGFCSCPQCEQHLRATGKLVQNNDSHNSKQLTHSSSTSNQQEMKLSSATTTQLVNLLNQSHNNQSKNDLYNLNNKLISDSKNLLSNNSQQKLSPPTSHLQYHNHNQPTLKPQSQPVMQQPKIHKPVPIIASPIAIKPKPPYMLQQQNTKPVSDPHANYIEIKPKPPYMLQQQNTKPVSDPHANYIEMVRNHSSHSNNNNNNINNNKNKSNNNPTTSSTLSSNAVILTHEYDEFMNNGLHITKLRNTFYNGDDNNSNNKKDETERPLSSTSVVSKRKHSVESSPPSLHNNDLNSSSNIIDNSAKRVATMNYLMQQLNNENEFKAKRISPSLSTSNINIPKITTIEDNDNDIELGEVIQLSNSTKDDSPPPNKKLLLNEDEPVTLSKKIMPFVRPRIIDWLEKCVEIAFKLTKKSNLSHETGTDLLKKSWPRLLLTYMIENSFEFCVTKDYNYNNNNESSSSNGNSNNDLPKEKHANELNNIISSGSSFQLNIEELDKLREFILLSEDNDETTIQQSLLDLKNMFESNNNHNNSKQQFTKLLSFLPSIYNVRANIIDSLFCTNLNSSYGKTVDEFLDKKYSTLKETK